MANPLSTHLIPAHWGGVGGKTDAEWLRLWDPAFVKVVTDDDTVPHLDELPPNSKIVVRHYPDSEQGHDRGFSTVRGALTDTHMPAHVDAQNGSGRDSYVSGPGAFGGDWTAKDGSLFRGMASKPEDVGRAHAERSHRIAAWCEARGVPRSRLWFEGLNEPMVWSVEPPAQVASYYRAFLIGLHARNLRGVVGNFGVGWPGNGGVQDAPVQWDFFKPAIDAMNTTPDRPDYLGLHEYWDLFGPEQNWRWWAGRFLQCPYRVPILITETNVDTGVSGNPGGGWQNLPGQMTERAKRNVGELAWYWQKCCEDGRVKGILPFTYDRAGQDGKPGSWQAFDVRNEDWLKELVARKAEFRETVQTPVILPPAPPATPPTDPLLAALQKAFAGRYADLRTQAERHPTLRHSTRASKSVRRIIVHHDAGSAVAPGETVARALAIARIHVRSNNWPGAGYHFLIGPDGTVCQLNGLDTISYHAGGGNNTDSVGICFAGNFMTQAPTLAALGAYVTLVNVLNVWAGLLSEVGHRDVAATQCPGDNLYRKLTAEPMPTNVPEDAIRQAAWAALGIAHNPEAALSKFAAAKGLGRPATQEHDTGGYRWQGFDGGIVAAPIGEWDKCEVVVW